MPAVRHCAPFINTTTSGHTPYKKTGPRPTGENRGSPSRGRCVIQPSVATARPSRCHRGQSTRVPPSPGNSGPYSRTPDPLRHVDVRPSTPLVTPTGGTSRCRVGKACTNASPANTEPKSAPCHCTPVISTSMRTQKTLTKKSRTVDGGRHVPVGSLKGTATANALNPVSPGSPKKMRANIQIVSVVDSGKRCLVLVLYTCTSSVGLLYFPSQLQNSVKSLTCQGKKLHPLSAPCTMFPLPGPLVTALLEATHLEVGRHFGSLGWICGPAHDNLKELPSDVSSSLGVPTLGRKPAAVASVKCPF